jgi:anti-sigma factor RsiW
MDIVVACEEIKRQLSGYLDGELDPTVCAELERHLSACDNCRVFVDTLRRTISLYRDHGRAPLPPDAHARLVSVLHLNE